MTLSIRPATPADLPLIAQFIRDLADYEKLADEVRFDEAKLGANLFGPRPHAEVVIAAAQFIKEWRSFEPGAKRKLREHPDPEVQAWAKKSIRGRN